MSIVSTDSGVVPSNSTPENKVQSDDQASASRTWQQAMRDAIRSREELLREVGVSASPAKGQPDFPIFVPREFVARMQTGEPDDPLLRQVLASPEEDGLSDGFTRDPVGDEAARETDGLLQKYAGRALWVLTGVCPIHCRYCFRQHFDYGSHAADRTQSGLAWLRSHTDVEEIILSGGDPLSIADDKLTRLIHELDSIEHLHRLRIHSRMPVVIPQRITPELVSALSRARLTPFLVLHINHPAEIDAAVLEAIARLVDAGIPVLNQAVLLAGVNDNEQALIELSRRLVNARVLPYYLHQLDRVQGASHFEVPEERGLALIEALRRSLPGYAVPRYVREVAGEASKTPIE